jgi:hypothetical protein
MKSMLRVLSLLLFTQILGASSLVRPKVSPEEILQRILNYKNLSFDQKIEFPEILYASETTLIEFQNDIEDQWGFRPTSITNAYVWSLNRIYIFDEGEYYESKNRCIDDSIAHELAHFIQVKYRGWDLNDESLEWDAIDTQTWYRETYCH